MVSIVYKNRRLDLKINYSFTYGRSNGIKDGVEVADDVVPVEAPLLDDDWVFFPKTFLKNEFICVIKIYNGRIFNRFNVGTKCD